VSDKVSGLDQGYVPRNQFGIVGPSLPCSTGDVPVLPRATSTSTPNPDVVVPVVYGDGINESNAFVSPMPLTL